MLKSAFLMVISSVTFGIISNTHLAWLSWVAFATYIIFLIIALVKYQDLENRVSKLEQKLTESEDTE